MYPGTYAAETPDRVAAVMTGTGETLSYGDLERRSVQLAHVLHEAGLRPGDVVALLTENHLRAFEVYWAAMRSGLYITAVNWHLKPDEVAYIVGDSGATALITSAGQAPTAEAITGLTSGVKLRLAYGGPVAGYGGYEDTIAAASDKPLADQPSGATMLYSSGTTGRPKGVRPPLPDRQVTEPGDTLAGLASQCVRCQPGLGVPVAGADLPRRAAALVRRHPGSRRHRGHDETVRRRTGPGGHPGPSRHPRAVRADHVRPDAAAAAGRSRPVRRLQPAGRHPRRGAVPGRGQAEDDRLVGPGPGGVLRRHRGQRHDGHRQRHLARPSRAPSAGPSPAPSGSAPTTGPNCPRARPAASTSRTKISRSPTTTTRTRPGPPSTAPTANWTTLGDIGYLDDDGFLFLTDRRAFTIISGGVNIYPQETENVLALHPAVYDVAVIGVPDPEMGESVAAFVQPAPGAVPGPELEQEIIAFVKSKIAGFKAPRTVRFVDSLPRSEAGKLMKTELKAKYAGG